LPANKNPQVALWIDQSSLRQQAGKPGSFLDKLFVSLSKREGHAVSSVTPWIIYSIPIYSQSQVGMQSNTAVFFLRDAQVVKSKKITIYISAPF